MELEGTPELMFVVLLLLMYMIMSMFFSYDSNCSDFLVSLFFSPHIVFCSGVKMVNQLLAGVHIASGAEAMAFGARLGLNTRMLFDFITNSEGSSW